MCISHNYTSRHMTAIGKSNPYTYIWTSINIYKYIYEYSSSSSNRRGKELKKGNKFRLCLWNNCYSHSNINSTWFLIRFVRRKGPKNKSNNKNESRHFVACVFIPPWEYTGHLSIPRQWFQFQNALWVITIQLMREYRVHTHKTTTIVYASFQAFRLFSFSKYFCSEFNQDLLSVFGMKSDGSIFILTNFLKEKAKEYTFDWARVW